jgi:hypothetical protein
MDLNELADGDIIQISQVQEALFTLGGAFKETADLCCPGRGSGSGHRLGGQLSRGYRV